MALANRFRAKAAAVGLGLASVVAPAAMADEQPQGVDGAFQVAAAETSTPTPVLASAAISTVPFTENAGREASTDARAEPGIAVGVWYGTRSRATPDRIVAALTEELNAAGIERVSFHFEQNDVPATGVMYFYGEDVSALHSLDTAKAGAQDAAGQYLFQQSQPGMQYQYGG